VPNFEERAGGAMPSGNPDDHLARLMAPDLFDLPWYRSLYRNFREVIHPPRLPPLEVTSRPVVVKDIWGLYGRQRKAFLLSTGFQTALVAAVALVGLTNVRVTREFGDLPRRVFLPTEVANPPRFHPSPQRGGGNGGDGSVLPASRGDFARAQPRQWVPPEAVPNNVDARLPMEPSIVAVDMPEVDSGLKRYGNPFGPDGPLSNGSGHNGGTGEGCCGGQGNGKGNGGGSGDGPNGFGNPVFVAGYKGLLNPVALYRPEPEYTDEARKIKLQGTVVLEVVVGRDGRPQIQKVLQALGLGLDEKAINTVSTWRFKPGSMDGKPVPVLVHIYVSFRLL